MNEQSAEIKKKKAGERTGNSSLTVNLTRRSKPGVESQLEVNRGIKRDASSSRNISFSKDGRSKSLDSGLRRDAGGESEDQSPSQAMIPYTAISIPERSAPSSSDLEIKPEFIGRDLEMTSSGTLVKFDEASLQWGIEPFFAVNRAVAIFFQILPIAASIEAKRVSTSTGGKFVARPDIKALDIMKSRNLCVNQERRIGPVPGIGVGSVFQGRCQIEAIGLHMRNRVGIDYGKVDGYPDLLATAIVRSGDSHDDDDKGECLLYQGSGGVTYKKKQASQQLTGGNLGLANSCKYGTPVRIIRGRNFKGKSFFTYDGLYLVSKWWYAPVSYPTKAVVDQDEEMEFFDLDRERLAAEMGEEDDHDSDSEDAVVVFKFLLTRLADQKGLESAPVQPKRKK